jgi:hypothetical protein
MTGADALERIVVVALERGRPVSFRATGGSMEPHVPTGSVVRVVPCGFADVRRGDLVAVRRPDGGIAVHRLVGRSAGGGLVTWGDALDQPDAWASRALLGRVTCVSRPDRPFARRARGFVRAAMHVALAALRLTGS